MNSDFTSELFLDIGYVLNYEKINTDMRDEVFALKQRSIKNKIIVYAQTKSKNSNNMFYQLLKGVTLYE
ncbi:staygreen family protein [Virgibacillus salinus]|uniref:staygreen family protein n=1 Tax=Virgibacillus salinus TaxID=553311 RepID=UPI001113D039|nr:staygreen family protein [Virgibacillus salinus]